MRITELGFDVTKDVTACTVTTCRELGSTKQGQNTWPWGPSVIHPVPEILAAGVSGVLTVEERA
jgi:hypothetical protein